MLQERGVGQAAYTHKKRGCPTGAASVKGGKVSCLVLNEFVSFQQG